MAEQIEDMIDNDADCKLLDRNAFINMTTRETYLLSDQDLAMGIIPTQVMEARIIQSGLCLMKQSLITEAVLNDMCGHLKKSCAERKIGQPDFPPWRFVASKLDEDLLCKHSMYAIRHGMSNDQMRRLLGIPGRHSELPMNRHDRLQEVVREVWNNELGQGYVGEQNFMSGFPHIDAICKADYGPTWKRMDMGTFDSMVAMLYNLKCRPFQALDQMTYIFLMLGGVSHNIARTADEVVNACVRDAQMRLIYRNRLNVIIYRNLEKHDPEMLGGTGVEGNFYKDYFNLIFFSPNISLFFKDRKAYIHGVAKA